MQLYKVTKTSFYYLTSKALHCRINRRHSYNCYPLNITRFSIGPGVLGDLYIGCYTDTWDRDLPDHKYTDSRLLNIETCLFLCREYTYFGLQVWSGRGGGGGGGTMFVVPREEGTVKLIYVFHNKAGRNISFFLYSTSKEK